MCEGWKECVADVSSLRDGGRDVQVFIMLEKHGWSADEAAGVAEYLLESDVARAQSTILGT